MDKEFKFKIIIGVVLATVIGLFIWAIVKFAPNPNNAPAVCYEVVDKTSEIDSHYNWFTKKQVVETVKIMMLKNCETGYTFSRKLHNYDENDYYRFKVGDKISVKGGYYEDRSMK